MATKIGGVTWDALVAAEPRLEQLLARARATRDDGSAPSFCANDVWYGHAGHPGLKPVLARLVGWNAVGGDLIRSEKAYDVAYETVYDALPDCRACWCL